MGRRPPPAVLVRPEDILEAVRTSMLLGAVVPELRAETEALAADLSELVRLRTAIAADQATLSVELSSLDQERQRLAGLIDARQTRLRTVERDAAGEAARIAELADRAASLKDLIEAMEEQIAVCARSGGRCAPGVRDAAAGEPTTLCCGGVSRSGATFAADTLRRGARHASPAGQRG
jgi:murein hydrolase activator